MVVLGITGKPVSGKSLVAEYLAKKHDFVHLDFTKDLLAPMLMEKNRPVIRKNLIALGLELRKGEDKAALVKLLANRIDGDRNYAIAGIRYPEEVNYLRGRYGEGFKLLAMKAGVAVRYKRTLEAYQVRQKHSGGRNMTLKEFLKMEDEPTEKIISRTMRMADFSVTNDGARKELYAKIDNIVRRLRI